MVEAVTVVRVQLTKCDRTLLSTVGTQRKNIFIMCAPSVAMAGEVLDLHRRAAWGFTVQRTPLVQGIYQRLAKSLLGFRSRPRPFQAYRVAQLSKDAGISVAAETRTVPEELHGQQRITAQDVISWVHVSR